MTNDPTVTTLTRWAVIPSHEDVVEQVTFYADLLNDYETADARRQEWDDAQRMPGYPHRVVRVDVTIVDPAPEQEGQG